MEIIIYFIKYFKDEKIIEILNLLFKIKILFRDFIYML